MTKAEIYLELDYTKVCRLCLDTKGPLQNIFIDDDDVPLWEQIQKVTEVTVIQGDLLPQNICDKCRNTVKMNYELIMNLEG